jgi:hypothetical protein
MSYSFSTTYFQITYDNTTPTDYSSLTGNQAGGLDSETAWQIQSLIKTTGISAVTGTPFNNGDTIIINGYSVAFSSTDTLEDAIVKINLMTKFTGVTANQSVAGDYITVQNAPGFEGTPFYLKEGNGTALQTLGLNASGFYPAGQYQNYPSVVGSTAFTCISCGSTMSINNVTVTFSGSGNIETAVASINNYTRTTGVAAEIAGPYVQLESAGWSQPFVITCGTNCAAVNLGFPSGTYVGPISNLTLSEDKERANMRWFQTVTQLESTATPSYFGSINRTGNIGNAALNTITFTVGYECYSALYTQALVCEPDYPATFTGTAAIQRWVARAMVNTWSSNRKVFAPCTCKVAGIAYFGNQAQILNITAQGVDTNVQVVSNNIVVTQLPGV